MAQDVEIARLTAEDATGQAFASVKRSLTGLEQSASSLRGALGAIGAGVSIAGLTGLVRGAIDAADNLNKLSQKVGVSVESLSKLQYAAKLSDVSTDELSVGLKKLSVNLQEAGRGSGDALAAFKALGFSQRELLNLSPDQAFARIAEQFAGIEDGAGKTALAIKLFGRSGADLIPLLNSGSAGLKQMADEAQRLGIVISADAAAAAERFNDNLTRISESSRALGIQLANTALPALTDFTEQLIESQRIFGSFGSALLNIGIKIDPFKTLAENLRKTRIEIEQLQSALQNIPAGSDARLRPYLTDQLDVAKKQLEFLKLQERQQIRGRASAGDLDARDLALAAGGAAPKRKAPALPDTGKKSKEEQEAIRAAQEIGRQTAAAAKDLAEIAEAYNRIDLEAQAKRDADALKQTAQAAADLKNILGQTTGGQLEEIARQERVLAEALGAGKINAKQFEEGLTVLNEKATAALGLDDKFKEIAKDGTDAFKELKFAVEGWGRAFTDTLATAIETGKLNFRSLAQSIIGDLLRMTIQAQITIPLFKAIGAATGFFANGGVFGPGGQVTAFATGGIVTKPTIFPFARGVGLMGEAGPEAIMPLTRTASGKLGVEAAGGGMPAVNVYIDSRTDRAEVMALSREGVRQALAERDDQMRRGRFSR